MRFVVLEHLKGLIYICRIDKIKGTGTRDLEVVVVKVNRRGFELLLLIQSASISGLGG